MARKRSPLLRSLAYLRHGERFNQGLSEANPRDRQWEDLYRSRWQHDKVVRSTHGVNCTGSCSWKVHVKDGIVTWETQATDYPSIGPDMPEYEPRGCPRGASFSWYLYSPMRVRYPYVRGVLWQAWQEARARTGDPVAAWESLRRDRSRVAAWQGARGKGGFVRVSWDEAAELVAASLIDTIREYGPDRIAGFSPIPAMSMVSFAAGSRFLSLLGGSMLSFYDWYADLPPASPQVWGEQTDVPESADWYNARYLIIWGTNLPMTRTPDAHFMVEARYNGTKVVEVSPDYAEATKFADEWLPARPGTDAALAMAMTHVILKEFYQDGVTPYFDDYVRRYTDLPFLVTLEPGPGEGTVAGHFLTAADLGLAEAGDRAEWKTVVWDERQNAPAVPPGSLGFRWDGSGRWNLHLEQADGSPLVPRLSFLGQGAEVAMVHFPYFGNGRPEAILRGVPVRRLRDREGRERRVTTVFDLLMAHTGVARGLPGDYPRDYDDPRPYTPAWQETITGVPRAQAIRVAREFANTAAQSRGRALIAMGAGTNHWYHSDVIYRAMLNLVLLTGSQGVNGGGWAHYVGQEKVRPLEGWQTLASARDWGAPARQQNGTLFFYTASEQFRFEDLSPENMTVPWAGRTGRLHLMDLQALAVRLGWLPSYPQFTDNPVALVAAAREAGARDDDEVAAEVARRLQHGEVRFAVEEPENPRNFPRVLFVWRSNLLGASGKGHEFFLKFLLGTSGHVLARPGAGLPETVGLEETVPEGKLDLLVTTEFRMTSTALYSDVLLPAATWYEKHDLSSTDMHPFVHPFNPAVSPPWEVKSDWQAFSALARAVSRLAGNHLPEVVEDLVAVPLLHDTPDELAQPGGRIRDWRQGEGEAVPGRTLPRLVVVRRRYRDLWARMTSVGPAAEEALVTKGVRINGEAAYRELRHKLGVVPSGPAAGRPDIAEDRQAADAILILSGTTNGHRAGEEWASMARVTGVEALKEVAAGHEEEAFSLKELTAQPRQAIPSPVWSGLEAADRRYSPFTVNVDYQVPWRTLTGRQHFYLDHELIADLGEGLPLYRPPLDLPPFAPGDPEVAGNGQKVLAVRYLTPHQKWGIHSTYADNPRMLTLFRGGQTVWISDRDAADLGIADNDWVELYSRNGAIIARAVVSHRLPPGMVLMYHAQDRTVGVPASFVTGDRGGTHNSVTRVIPKPTHFIGGYAQLSYGFNYYGPTGHQRDAMVLLRPVEETVRTGRKGVNWLAD